MSIVFSFFIYQNNYCFAEKNNIINQKYTKNDIIIDSSVNFFGEIKTENTVFFLYIRLKEFGNQRLTKRLIVLSKDNKYIGMYDIPELPTKIKKNKVIFPLEEKWGNSITFEGDSPPKNIYLDGETYSFFRGDE